MYIIIQNSDSKPIYEQIIEQLKDKIITNELEHGEMLPSIRSLARDLKISVITTKKAYEELEKDGYIETIPGKGSYVSSKNKEFMKEEMLQKIEHHLTSAIMISNTIQMPQEELMELLKFLYEEDQYEK